MKQIQVDCPVCADDLKGIRNGATVHTDKDRQGCARHFAGDAQFPAARPDGFPVSLLCSIKGDPSRETMTTDILDMMHPQYNANAKVRLVIGSR